MIFTIASVGGSGTKTLSNILNSLDGVICSHGPSLSEFDDFLPNSVENCSIVGKLLYVARKRELIVGNVHGFPGPEGRAETIEAGGRAAVIFRHPVDRALSLTRIRTLTEDTIASQAHRISHPTQRYKAVRDIIANLLKHRDPAGFKRFEEAVALMNAARLPKIEGAIRYRFESVELKDQIYGELVFHHYAIQFLFRLFIGAKFDLSNFHYFDGDERYFFEKHIRSGEHDGFIKYVTGRNDFDVGDIVHEHNRSKELGKEEMILLIERGGVRFSDIIESFIYLMEHQFNIDVAAFYEGLGYRLRT